MNFSTNLFDNKIGRYSDIKKIQEISELEYGMDFRKPEFRREVFLRFYEFHLKYRSHPGGVYFMFEYLRNKFSLSDDDMYWLAFINGVTQHIITSWRIFLEFPSFTSNPDKIQSFIYDNWDSLGWDMDRRYVKSKFSDCLKSYQGVVGGSQIEFFNSLCIKNKFDNFDVVWGVVFNKFKYFGRLSTFSYLEYLKIIGLNIDCNSLFLRDISGSKSHRNGLCIVLGRDDLDFHDKINPVFTGYSEQHLNWLEIEGATLLSESINRFKDRGFIDDVSYFTLESTLCCYKSWYRPNRRYPNVYMDMMYNRIRDSEIKGRGVVDVSPFFDARKIYLPNELLLEYNKNDPGLSKEKQNHFLKTGEVIMMDLDFECFKNSFNKNVTLDELF